MLSGLVPACSWSAAVPDATARPACRPADTTLADAAALDDPGVVGVEHRLEIGVGDDLVG